MPDEAPNTINTSQAIGKVTKFVVGADWESYTKQLDFYFLANGVKEPKIKKAVLLINLPVETYQLAKDLVAPAQLKDDANNWNLKNKYWLPGMSKTTEPGIPVSQLVIM